MPWIQVYDPLGSPWLSTLAAALPIVLLLFTLAVLEWRAHMAALAGLIAALLVSIVLYGMPVSTAMATAVYGAAYGLLPIGWIIVNAVFLYNLTVETGQFEIVKSSVAHLSADRRIGSQCRPSGLRSHAPSPCGLSNPRAMIAASSDEPQGSSSSDRVRVAR
jgi:lactate permease